MSGNSYIIPSRDIDIICYKCNVSQAEFYRTLNKGHSYRFGLKEFPLLNYYCLYKSGYGVLDMFHFSNEYMDATEFNELLHLKGKTRTTTMKLKPMFIKKHGLSPTFTAIRQDGTLIYYYHKLAIYKPYGMEKLVPLLESNPIRKWRFDKDSPNKGKIFAADNKIVSYAEAATTLNINFYRIMRMEAGSLAPSELEVELMSPYIASYGNILEWGQEFNGVLNKVEVNTAAGDAFIDRKTNYIIRRGAKGYAIFRDTK